MRKSFVVMLALGAAGALLLFGADWASQSGNPQRDGWARNERDLTKAKIPDLKLLYKTRLENKAVGLDALTSPIIIGNLITYRGFKEMLLVGGSSDNAFSVDVDLNRVLWKTHFNVSGKPPSATAACPGGLTGAVAMSGTSGLMRFGMGRGGRGAVGPGRGGAAGARAGRGAANSVGMGRGPQMPSIFGGGFGGNGSIFLVSSDGYLRFARESDGNDTATPAIPFVPANSKISAVNVNGTSIYAASVDGCGGNPNGIYAVDYGTDEHKVVSFMTNGSGPSGAGGTAASEKGPIIAQIPDGHGEGAGNYNDTVVALAPDTLQVKDFFTPQGDLPPVRKGIPAAGLTPAVFSWNGKEIVAAGGRDGRIYLLDSSSLGGADHHTPLFRSEVVTAPDSDYSGNGLWGDFATWQDEDTNTRWLYAPVWGPVSGAANFVSKNGDASHGSVIAFKVEDRNGSPALSPQWVSSDIVTPASPATTNGLVFVLSSGESARLAKENGKPYSVGDREKMAGHATLYVLDGATGKQLFSSGGDASTFSHASGLAIANSRVYFTTHDSSVYCYGFPALEPQLTER
jgi:hypothetical protein